MNTGAPREPGANGYVSPGGTVPFPAPEAAYRPVGYWEGEPGGIAWQAVAPGEQNVTVTGVWGTPLFNLRPDADSASSRQNRAFPINRVAGTQLFVAINGLRNPHLGMECYARILGHPVDPLKVTAVGPDTNMTADLSTGLDVAILSFLPFSGFPLKYWQVQIRFDFTSVAPAVLPNITLQAGIY
jgi:hypothetical protein